MEYKIVDFEYEEEDTNKIVCKEKLEEFIKDADFIILNYGSAVSKDKIKSVGYSLRGATLEYINNEGMDYGYSVSSKLVKI